MRALALPATTKHRTPDYPQELLTPCNNRLPVCGVFVAVLALLLLGAPSGLIADAAPSGQTTPLSHDAKAGTTDDVPTDESGIGIVRLSWQMKFPPTTSHREFDEALANTKAQQQSAARMRAVLDGELSVFEAEQLSGQEKIDRLERGARSGEAAAAMELGDALDVGDGMSEDTVRAFGYFRAAALGGRMDAAHNLGAAYAAGRGVRRDFTEALAWLIVARARGDKSGADEQLRRHLLERQRVTEIAAAEKRSRELGTKVSRAEIIAALPPAAPLIFVPAAATPATEVNASELESDSDGGTSRPVPEVVVMTMTGARLTWPTLPDLQRAARHEEPAALDALGRLLVAGKLLPADPLRAVVLLERSAELGDVDASYQLGELYSGGEKILRDDAKAFAYYMKAAQGGCGLAMGNVGVYFTNGRGTERDYVKGLAWLIVARHFGVDLGQEKRLRPFLLQHDPADVAKAEKMSDGLIREIEARVR